MSGPSWHRLNRHSEGNQEDLAQENIFLIAFALLLHLRRVLAAVVRPPASLSLHLQEATTISNRTTTTPGTLTAHHLPVSAPREPLTVRQGRADGLRPSARSGVTLIAPASLPPLPLTSNLVNLSHLPPPPAIRAALLHHESDAGHAVHHLLAVLPTAT